MPEQTSRLIIIFVLLAVLVLAGAFGYVTGASYVQVVDLGLWQLDVSYQTIYVQSVADAYSLDNNADLAAYRLSFLCQENGDLQTALDNAAEIYGVDPVKSANLQQLSSLVQSGVVTQNAEVGVCGFRAADSIASTMRLIGPAGLVLVLLGIVGYGVTLMIRESEEDAVRPARAGSAEAPSKSEPGTTKTEDGGKSAGAESAAPSRARSRTGGFSLPFGKKSDQNTAPTAAQRGAQLSAAASKTDYESKGVDPPIVQFMTTYLHGDDLYDDSFSIESPSGEFLGETGVGISDTIGAEDTKNVSAFEVWLFDKNDIRTITKVLMSEHAYNDEAIRAKLAPKGEAVLIKHGEKVVLETATLRVAARIVDMSYGSGPQPPNSYFERITIELAAWKREEGGSSSGSPPETSIPSGRRGGM